MRKISLWMWKSWERAAACPHAAAPGGSLALLEQHHCSTAEQHQWHQNVVYEVKMLI